MPGNALTAHGCYTDSAHFSGEKIACLFMSRNSAEKAVRRGAGKNGERFLRTTLQPPVVSTSR